MSVPPLVVLIAGPNGAAKSTLAPDVLRGPFAVNEFVNADAIALGLSAFRPDTASMAAGRAMLARLKWLAAARADFAFETTLASRTFAPWLRGLVESGYRAHLVFVSLWTPELAVSRVAERVRLGGHDVPEGTIRRRHAAGLRNFFELYGPLELSWQLFDNSGAAPFEVANRDECGRVHVLDAVAWQHLSGART